VIVTQGEALPVTPLIPGKQAVFLIVIFQAIEVNTGFQPPVSSQKKVPADLIPENTAQKLSYSRGVIKIHLSQRQKKRTALLIVKDAGIIQDDLIPFFCAQPQPVPCIQKKSPPISPAIDTFQLKPAAKLVEKRAILVFGTEPVEIEGSSPIKILRGILPCRSENKSEQEKTRDKNTEFSTHLALLPQILTRQLFWP
jgi:hypothetical protein